MSRKAGHLALQAGIAGGADVILIPEIPYSIENVCKHLDRLCDRWGHKFAIVVVAEGRGGRGSEFSGFCTDCLIINN